MNIYFAFRSSEEGVPGVTIQLDYIDGLPMLSKTSGFIPDFDLEFFDNRLVNSVTPWGRTVTVSISSPFLPGVDALRFSQVDENGWRGILTELHTQAGYQPVRSIGHAAGGPTHYSVLTVPR